MTMHNREIELGVTYEFPASFNRDMTLLEGVLRLRRKGSSGAVDYERATDDGASVWVWTNRGAGEGYWKYESDLAIVAGVYRAEVFTLDGGAPEDRRPIGQAWYTIKQPDTGSFA